MTLPGGVDTDRFGGNKTVVSTCQDYLQDASGKACNKAAGRLPQ
jgi:hypothetical protein